MTIHIGEAPPSTTNCNYFYPNQIACVPIPLGENCSDPHPHTYHAHFTAPGVWDLAWRLQSCLQNYLEEHIGQGLYCSDTIFKGADPHVGRWDSISIYYESYQNVFRKWEVKIRDVENPLSYSNVKVIEVYAKTMIDHCENSKDNSLLYISLVLGSIVVVFSGWIAYCKYRDYQSAHLLDHMKTPKKTPLQRFV